MKSLFPLVFALGLLPGLWAADPAPIDEAALFGASVLQEVDPRQAASGTINLTPGATSVTTPAPAPGFVPTLRWGGSADASVNAAWTLHSWSELPPWDRGSAVIGSVVYLDARPTSLSRFYFEGNPTYDVEKSTTYKVREMFLDTSWEGKANFRAGKQRIAWGVGTWFSPADVLSLEAIDLNDTAKKREGPFAVKLDVPVGLHSLTLYSVLPQDGVKKTAFAPRAEFLWGTWEIGLAGYWRPDFSLRPRAMVLGTGDLGPLNFTFEGVMLWGSDRRWVRVGPGGNHLETYTDNDNPYYQAAVGLGGSWTSAEQDLGLALQAQYFYNGNGYEDPSVLADSAQAVKKLVNDGALSASDLTNPGQHYLAANLGVTKLFGDALNLGASGWVNLSDFSFRAAPSVTLKPVSLTTVRLQTTWNEGAPGSQYSPSGRLMTTAFRLGVFETVTAEVQLPWKPDTGEKGLKLVLSFSVPGF